MTGPALYKHGPIDAPLRVEEGLRGPYPSWLKHSLWMESGNSGNAFPCVPAAGTPPTCGGQSHANAYTDNPGQTKWGTEQNETHTSGKGTGEVADREEREVEGGGEQNASHICMKLANTNRNISPVCGLFLTMSF